jgi:hypothetical protein
MGKPISLTSGTMVSRQLASGDFGSGCVTVGVIASGAITSGSIGLATVCSGNVDAAALDLLGSSDYDRFRMKGYGSGMSFSASGMAQCWYPAGFAAMNDTPSQSLASFPGQCIYCIPICSEKGGPIDDIRFYRNFATSGESFCIGVYDNVDATMADIWPGNIISQASGLLASGTFGPVTMNPGSGSVPSLSLDPNKIYWLALRMPSTAGTYSLQGMTNCYLNMFGVNHKFEENSQIFGVNMPWSGTPLPDTFPTSSGNIMYYSGYFPTIAMHYA